MPPDTWIHILGGGQWQLPTIELARSLGFRVLCTDVYAERPGYSLADAHVVADISDVTATLAVARQFDVGGILCDTTDVGVPTMAYVAEQMGLPGIGYETALNFTNKLRMRQITSHAGIPNPHFRPAKSVDEAFSAVSELGFPLVFKPVDGQSSRGVHTVHNLEGVVPAFRDARAFSRESLTIVESHLDGTEVTVEGYCVNGEPIVAGISDKDHFCHRPEVASRLTYPAILSDQQLMRVRDVNADVVRALGLQTGITHAEYMVTGDEVFLIEIAARGGGSRVYSHIVPYLTGVDIPRMYLEFAMGRMSPMLPDGTDRAANLAFFEFGCGRVTSISGVEEARQFPGVSEIFLEVSVGDELRPPTDDRSRPGHVLVLGQTRKSVLSTTQAVFDCVRVTTE